MQKNIVARWQSWSGDGLEHLVVRQSDSSVVADGVVLAGEGSALFAVRYTLECDSRWTLREAAIEITGEERKIAIVSSGRGEWRDGQGKALPHLDGAIDIDLSVSPFTNTLPIRRLGLEKGQSGDILAAYVRFPELEITTDPQRYTCLDPMRRYRYESLDSDFVRDIEVDPDGLVVTYPGLFRRTAGSQPVLSR